MQCLYCGGMIEPRLKFCLSCGRSVKNGENENSTISKSRTNGTQTIPSHDYKDNYRVGSKCPKCGERLGFDRRYREYWCRKCKINFTLDNRRSTAFRGDNSIHPRKEASRSFKCLECGSKLQYNTKELRFWCDTCGTYRFPDPNYYDVNSLKISKNLYLNLGRETITDIPCPFCNTNTHFDCTFGIYWCSYCNRYTELKERDDRRNELGDDDYRKKFVKRK